MGSRMDQKWRLEKGSLGDPERWPPSPAYRAATPLWGHEGETDMSSEGRIPGLWEETGKESGDLDPVPHSTSD